MFVVLVVARIIWAVRQRKVGCNCFQEILVSLDEGKYKGGALIGMADSIGVFPILFTVYMSITLIGYCLHFKLMGVQNIRQEMLRGLVAYSGFLGSMGVTHIFCFPYYRRLLIRWVLCSQDIGTLEELLMGYLPVDVSPYLVGAKGGAGTEHKKADPTINDECSICAEEMTSQRCKLTCGHAFHALCVEKWLRRVHSCPLCRQPVILKLRATIIDY
jgi:hypothetical protein